MKNALSFFILFLTFSLAACSSDAEFIQLSQQQFVKNTEAGTAQIILDVRSAEEFAEGHIPNAINISHDLIASKLGELRLLTVDQQIPLVVYCRSGRRAGVALTTLQENGFTNMMHLEGDMNGWQQANLPEEK